jgi:hypothetical protein
MITQNELKAFYETELKPKLLFYEKQRKLIVIKTLSLWIIYAILVILPILMIIILGNLSYEDTYRNKDAMIFFYVLVIIINMITFFIIIRKFYKKMKSSYQTHFKTAVVAPLLTLIDKNLTYELETNFSSKTLSNSQFFKHKYAVNKLSGEDYVSGILDGTSVKFSEVHAQNVEYHFNSSGMDKSTTTVFKGLFFTFDLNWDVEGITIILPKFLKALDLQLVALVKSELKDKFVVYSDNPMITNLVFSSAFMQRLLALRRELKRWFYLSLINGKLYLAIPFNEDLFEPPVFHTVLDFQIIQTTFKYLQLSQEIIELIALLKPPNSTLEKTHSPSVASEITKEFNVQS